MKNLFVWMCIAAMAIFALGGCGKKDDNKILIGVVAKSSTNDVFQAAHAGAKDAAKALAAKFGKEVVVEIRTPDKEDPKLQAEAIEALVRQGAKGILVSCTNGDQLKKSIDDAVAAGVVVVTFDSDSPNSKRLACYGADDFTCGKKVAEALVKSMGGKGTVAILAGNQSATNLANRVKGVQSVLDKEAGITQLKIGPIYHEEKPGPAADKLKEMMLQHQDIKGWALVGGWPLFTTNALPWKTPGEVKVVSVDALPQQLDYVRTKYVDVLYGQDCYGWGYKGVEILLDKIVNNKNPEGADMDGKITDQLTAVTPENADEYGKKWQQWLAK